MLGRRSSAESTAESHSKRLSKVTSYKLDLSKRYNGKYVELEEVGDRRGLGTMVREELDESVDRVYEHRNRRVVDLEKGVSGGAKVSRG